MNRARAVAPREATDLLVRRYGRLAQLSSADQDFLHAQRILDVWPARTEIASQPHRSAPRLCVWPARTEIALRNGGPAPRFLVMGWAARVRYLGDGRRQILSHILPGDGLGLCESPGPLSLTSTMALTPVSTIDASEALAVVRARDDGHDGLRQAVRVATTLEEALLVNQVVRNGRQTAFERVCHFILETHWRLQFVGLAEGGAMPWQLTQEAVADTLGLSVVHVNRMLQQMRRDGLVDINHNILHVLNPDLMSAIAEFAPPQTVAGAWAA